MQKFKKSLLFLGAVVILALLLYSCGSQDLPSAASAGDVEKVKTLLLKKDIHINAKDSKGRTALMYAATKGYTEIVKLLLDKGADVNLKDDTLGGTAIMGAAFMNHLEIAQQLIYKGADVNLKANNGNTALGMATQRGNMEIANLLKNAGAKE